MTVIKGAFGIKLRRESCSRKIEGRGTIKEIRTSKNIEEMVYFQVKRKNRGVKP